MFIENRKYFLEEIKKFKDQVRELNKNRKGEYLSSIDYMLSSKLYVDSIIEDLFFLFKNSHSDKKILDFGAGSGFLSNILALKFKKVYGLETEDMSKMIEYTSNEKERQIFQKSLEDKQKLWSWAKRNHTNIDLSFYGGTQTSFADNYFDNICAYAVIEHLSPSLAEKILLELHRITKKDGKLFIFKLPQKLSITEFFAKILGMGSHPKKFSRKEIILLLSKAGWDIEKIFYSDFIFEFPPNITNSLYYPLKILNKILANTPFRILGHNFTIVAVKK